MGFWSIFLQSSTTNKRTVVDTVVSRVSTLDVIPSEESPPICKTPSEQLMFPLRCTLGLDPDLLPKEESGGT